MSKIGTVGAVWLSLMALIACSTETKGFTFAPTGGVSGMSAAAGGTAPSVGGSGGTTAGRGASAGTTSQSGAAGDRSGAGGDGGSGLGGTSAGGGSSGAATVDVQNCGRLGNDCTRLPNVKPGAAGIECQNEACFVPPSACAPGFGHCSDRPDDGCEANLADPERCGGCDKRCPAETPLCAVSAGIASCVAACQPPASDVCSNSCVDLAADPTNCGKCGHDCTALPGVGVAADVECRAGLCYVPPSACVPGTAHCSTRPDDGCEADLTSPANCGGCGKACAAPMPVCGLKAGTAACGSDCTAPLPDLCEASCVALATDVKNCGECGHDCTALPHVRASAAGIECRAGACVVPATACAPGFGHCSSRADDGCEADLTRPETCGQCNKQCSAPTALCSTNTSPSTCSSSCVAPAAPDLCGSNCVNLASDPANCGSCGNKCGSLPNVRAGAAGVECRSGTCFIPPSACVTGFGHCSSNAADGCEVNLTLPANCGSCGTTCTAPKALCSTTGGTPTCSSSCVSPAPNLCGTKCVDTKTDPTNCGTCGHDCTALPNLKSGAAVQCNGSGACVVPQTACAAGFANCSSSATDTDGCETRTNTNTNCGACGTTCSLPNTSASCATGSCVAGTCTTGFDDCTTAAGCETRLNTTSNCGGCGISCGLNGTCSATTNTCGCLANTRACPGMTGCFEESVTACGASCTACPVVAHGTRQCLSGGRCDATCEANYVRCDAQPRVCVPSTWSFESNTAEGFYLVDTAPSQAVDGFSVSTARAAPGAGTHSLALAATFNCNRVSARVQLDFCEWGVTSDLLGKTLTFNVYLDGPALYGGANKTGYVSLLTGGDAPNPTYTLEVGRWVTVSAPLTAASLATTQGFALAIFMVAADAPPASLCRTWTGTIYYDNISVK